jgi:LmbE family N-acetylglucosaminyl deacetylase
LITIFHDLEKLIANNNFNKIVTHNHFGEYGHIQHKQIHKIVYNICDKLNLLEKLFIFSYDNNDNVLNNSILERKKNLIEYYGFDVEKIKIEQHGRYICFEKSKIVPYNYNNRWLPFFNWGI